MSDAHLTYNIQSTEYLHGLIFVYQRTDVHVYACHRQKTTPVSHEVYDVSITCTEHMADILHIYIYTIYTLLNMKINLFNYCLFYSKNKIQIKLGTESN